MSAFRAVLPAGTIKRIHVDQQAIRFNLKAGDDVLPPVTVQTSKGSHKARTATIHGKSRLMYRPHKPLSCGARLWLETRAAVEVET